MNRRMVRQIIGMCFLFFIAVQPISVFADESRNSPTPIEHWEVKRGDSPRNAEGFPVWIHETSGEWEHSDGPAEPLRYGQKGYMWIRTVLPEIAYRDPALQISARERFEIYTEEGRIYRFGELDDPEKGQYLGTPYRLAILPEGLEGQSIWVRIYSEHLYVGLMEQVQYGERSFFFLSRLKADADQIVFGSMYILIGGFALYVYLRFRTERQFLSFALFAICFGAYSFCRTTVVPLLWDHPLIWTYLEMGVLMMGTAGVVWLVEHVVGSGRYEWVSRLRKLHFVYAFGSLILAALRVVSIPEVLQVFQGMILVTFVVVSIQVFLAARSGNRRARGFLAALGCLALFGFVEILDNRYLPHTPLPSLISFGVLGFMLIMASMLIRNLISMMTLLRNHDKLSMVGQLAAGVAHEIRNPLTVVSGFLQLIKKDPKHVQNIDMLMHEVRRMDDMIREFLSLARPAPGKYAKHHVQHLVDELLVLFDARASKRTVRIEHVALSDIPKLYCEANQLKQVFLNLLQNAVESMKDGGYVRIESGMDGNHAVIRFIDDGEGISPDLIHQIGQPFLTTKQGGSGLGIMISRKIVAEHGGALRFSSKQGQGTTVEVSIPIERRGDADFARGNTMQEAELHENLQA